MAAKGQMTGMLGVYLAAAELTSKRFIVSVTSRSAKGVDLLATDQLHKKAWSIQVKTNRKATNFWLLTPAFEVIKSPSHIYIFINLRGENRPDYYIVPSVQVAKRGVNSSDGKWPAYYREDKYKERWSIFGSQP